MESEVKRRSPFGSGMEPGHIRALGVLVLLLCAWIGYRLWGSSPDVMVPTDQRYSLRLDPNTATAGELAALPEIGPATAGRIVAYREAARQRGNARPFAKLADLDEVQGLGPATLELIEPYLTFGAK